MSHPLTGTTNRGHSPGISIVTSHGHRLLVSKKRRIEALQRSPHDLVEIFRKVPNIVRVESGHGDAAITSKVDMRFLGKREGLFRV